MATADLLALLFLTGGVVPHSASAVVGVVGIITVGAGDRVVTDGEPLLPVLLVNVRFFAFLA